MLILLSTIGRKTPELAKTFLIQLFYGNPMKIIENRNIKLLQQKECTFFLSYPQYFANQ